MSNLAQKYRPKSFDEISEQNTVVDMLRKFCESPNMDVRNFLLIGPAGCGKTSLSFIMAKTLNGDSDSYTFMDAASHGGAEDVRKLVEQAHTYPVGMNYRIFVLDECFPGTTKISMDSGYKCISDIHTGDCVQSMYGIKKVTHIFKSSVLTSRLCCVKINDINLVTTIDHLFFTNNGWVKAIDLQKGDIVYDNQSMSKLWEGISESSYGSDVLLSSMFGRISETALSAKNENYKMSDMRKTCAGEECRQAKDVFYGVQEQINYRVEYTENLYRAWDGITEIIIRPYEEMQSNVKSGDCSSYVEYQGEEWDTSSMVGSSRWKREIHNSADSLIRSIRQWMGIGIPDSNKMQQIRSSVSYLLQSRPWLSENETCSRGGWQKSSFEKFTIERSEKDGLSGKFRVESVEIYKRGSNDELFRGHFSDTELSKPTVTMYDLEVEDAHSYFAEGILVHNCHSFSSAAWSALLTTLESNPAKSIFILCTTNPEKIPATILSRVQVFQLSKISVEGITDRLKHIIECENKEGHNITYTDDAVSYIAKLSGGGLRDACTLLDKALAYSENITSENLMVALNLPAYDDYFSLLASYAKHDNESITKLINKVYNSGVNFVKWFEGFHSFVTNVTKYIFMQDITATMIPAHYVDKVSNYGVKHSVICMKLSNRLLKMIADLKSTSYLQEVALTYLCVPQVQKKEQTTNG